MKIIVALVDKGFHIMKFSHIHKEHRKKFDRSRTKTFFRLIYIVVYNIQQNFRIKVSLLLSLSLSLYPSVPPSSPIFFIFSSSIYLSFFLSYSHLSTPLPPPLSLSLSFSFSLSRSIIFCSIEWIKKQTD